MASEVDTGEARGADAGACRAGGRSWPAASRHPSREPGLDRGSSPPIGDDTMMTRRMILVGTVAVALALPLVAQAQAAGPINPSTASWTAPTTNANATPLQDLNLY